MRTAIRDIAEGAEMGLETGSVPGLSCSLYGGVDFGEDYIYSLPKQNPTGL